MNHRTRLSREMRIAANNLGLAIDLLVGVEIG